MNKNFLSSICCEKLKCPKNVIFTPIPCFRKEALGAEPCPEKCHAEFISVSLSGSPLPARPATPFGRAGKAGISESIYINPESRLSRIS
jgi:hypothetical protein